jgi:hypothetical protein
MSLLNRTPVRIGRATRSYRDDRVFVIATEDTDAPKAYFEQLGDFERVRVVSLPTDRDSGLSSPSHVVERLKAYQNAVEQDIQDGDEFWVLIDTDHRFEGTHLSGTLEALRMARHSRFGVAISNPCFEIWLLLHHEKVNPHAAWDGCKSVEERLRTILGSYRKAGIQPGQFPRRMLDTAIQNARELEESTGAAREGWPKPVGTQIHKLFERLRLGGTSLPQPL